MNILRHLQDPVAADVRRLKLQGKWNLLTSAATLLKEALLARLILLHLSVVVAAVNAAVPPPNILWITAEDMGLNLGCYGDACARTPNLDAFARQSVRYANCFAAAPVCAVSRFTLITGTYSTAMGTSNHRSQFPIPPAIRGFPSYLRQAGYYCANNAKTDYNLADEAAFKAAAWDQCSGKAHWRGRKPGQPFFAVFNLEVTHQSRTTAWPYDQFERQVQSRLPAAQRQDPAKVRLPAAWPDTPTMRRSLARYYDCIAVMDQQFGEFLQQLEQDGLAQDTIVVFFADNGPGFPGGKSASLNLGVHEPFMIRFPKRFQSLAPAGPGTTLDRLISFVDFAPTMLGLAGIAKPSLMNGKAFLGPNTEKPAQYAVGVRDRIDETLDVSRWVRDARYHYVRNYRTHFPVDQNSLDCRYNGTAESVQEIRRLKAEGKLSATQKLYWGETRPAETLFDVTRDPYCLSNLASSPEHQPQLENMRRCLGRWLRETRDLGLVPEGQLLERTKGRTPRDLATQPGYPFERILAAAELSGRGPSALAEQMKLLNDADETVRYWAVVGLHCLGEDARPAIPALQNALADSSASVRIEAAWTLAELGQVKSGVSSLARELDTDNEWAAVHAARALNLLGSRASAALPPIRSGLEKWSKQYPAISALNNALDKLQPGATDAPTHQP